MKTIPFPQYRVTRVGDFFEVFDMIAKQTMEVYENDPETAKKRVDELNGLDPLDEWLNLSESQNPD